MLRTVQAEILDSLDEDDPAARANRRDLRRLNRLMGNYRWCREQLRRELRPGDRLLELGAGDGELGRLAAGALPPGAGATGLDLGRRPERWPDAWAWRQADILSEDALDGADVVLANLILHQFDDDALASLGRRLGASGARRLIANEPARRRLHLWQMRLSRPLGWHPVSRHDAAASIRAGFLGHELAERLGLDPAAWRWTARTTFLGAYRFVAARA